MQARADQPPLLLGADHDKCCYLSMVAVAVAVAMAVAAAAAAAAVDVL